MCVFFSYTYIQSLHADSSDARHVLGLHLGAIIHPRIWLIHYNRHFVLLEWAMISHFWERQKQAQNKL